MIKEDAVFQRTDSGREEIRRKTHGLTQSERLILILVDGVADVSVIRNKLKGVNDIRFARGLNKLVRHHFVQEVLLPMAGQEAETVDTNIAELFLRQDALDPVTIISLDPEDEYDSSELMPVERPAASASASSSAAIDLRSWQSGKAVNKEPFPIIRTESRISPPADVRLPHDPLSERIRRLAPLEPVRPIVRKADETTAVGPSATPSGLQAARPVAVTRQKEVSLWLFWVLLTLVSILTAGYILFS